MPITITDENGNALNAEDAKSIDDKDDKSTNVEDGQGNHDDDQRQGARDDDAGADENVDAGAASGDITVSIGGDEPAAEDDDADLAPAHKSKFAQLRDVIKAKEKEARELRRQVEALQPAPVTPTLPPKPTMADDDVDYDADKFAAKVEAWYVKKTEVDAHATKTQEAQQKTQARWQSQLDIYAAEKAKVAEGAKDFEQAEQTVTAALSKTQQAAVVKSKHNAMIVLALGRNEKKLKELADIHDPLEFAIAIGEIGAILKVTKKTSLPPPEQTGARGTRIGSAASTGGKNAKEQQLIDQAAKTGDITALAAWKRGQKAAAAK